MLKKYTLFRKTVPLTVKQFNHKESPYNISKMPIATFTAFNEQLAILLRGAKTSEGKLNHAVHFDGVF
jgi:hypothetical protein